MRTCLIHIILAVVFLSSFDQEARATPPPQATVEAPFLSLLPQFGPSVLLRWTVVPNIVGYNLYRQDLVTGQMNLFLNVVPTIHQFTDTNLDPATEYCYQVGAVDAGGVEARSALTCVTTFQILPLAPTGAALQILAADQLALSWIDNSVNEDGFDILRREADNPDSVYRIIHRATRNTISFTDQGLAPSTQYCYQVRARNSVGTSDVTEACTFTLPAIPDNLALNQDAGALSLSLAWTLDDPVPTTFRIFRQISGGTFDLLQSIPTSTTTFTDEQITAGLDHCYQLTATRDDGVSSQVSETVCAAPTALAPTIQTLQASQITTVDLTWTAVPFPNQLGRIQRREEGGTWITIGDSLTVSSFTDPDLEEVTTYCYQVLVFNANTTSPYGQQECLQTSLITPGDLSTLTLTPDPNDLTDRIVANWTASTPASFLFYEYEIREVDEDWPNAPQTTTNLATTMGDLTEATSYEIRVRAVRFKSGVTMRSAWRMATTQTYLGHWPGDTNGDQVVNTNDVALLTSATCYGQTTSFSTDGTDISWEKRPTFVGTTDPTLLRCDTDRNGVINLFDFLAIAAHYERTTDAGPPPDLPPANIESAAQFQRLSQIYAGFNPSDAETRFQRFKTALGDLLTTYRPNETELPTTFALHANFPNPFNPQTTVVFDLPESVPIELTLYNPLGQKVKTLLSGFMPAGSHQISMNLNDLPSGTYFYTLRTPEHVFSRTLVLLK